MPEELIKDPTACIQYFHKILEDGTLEVKIGSNFGSYYLYINPVYNCYVIFTSGFRVSQLTIVLHCPLSFLILRLLSYVSPYSSDDTQ